MKLMTTGQRVVQDLNFKLVLLLINQEDLDACIFKFVVFIVLPVEGDQVVGVLGAGHHEPPVALALLALLALLTLLVLLGLLDLVIAQLQFCVLSREYRQALTVGVLSGYLHACAIFSVALELLGRSRGGHGEHSDCELLDHCFGCLFGF